MTEKKSKLKKTVVSHDEWSSEQVQRGRREHFSLMILQGLCANNAYINVNEDELAENATIYADALIAELDKKNG